MGNANSLSLDVFSSGEFSYILILDDVDNSLSNTFTQPNLPATLRNIVIPPTTDDNNLYSMKFVYKSNSQQEIVNAPGTFYLNVFEIYKSINYEPLVTDVGLINIPYDMILIVPNTISPNVELLLYNYDNTIAYQGLISGLPFANQTEYPNILPTSRIANFQINLRQMTLCLHADSIVHTTKGLIPIKDLVSTNEKIYLIDVNGNPVKLLFNAILGITRDFIRIKKDALGKDSPNEDLLITDYHPIMIDGKEVLPRDYIDDKKIIMDSVKPEKVYALCTTERIFTIVNNIPVCTWKEDELNNLVTKNKVFLFKKL